MWSLKDMQKRQNQKSRADSIDGETHFIKLSHVAAILCQLTPKQQAIAKLQIDQILLNVKFPFDPYTHNYYDYPSNYYDN